MACKGLATALLSIWSPIPCLINALPAKLKHRGNLVARIPRRMCYTKEMHRIHILFEKNPIYIPAIAIILLTFRNHNLMGYKIHLETYISSSSLLINSSKQTSKFVSQSWHKTFVCLVHSPISFYFQCLLFIKGRHKMRNIKNIYTGEFPYRVCVR